MLLKQLQENESVQRMARDRRGSAVITIKGGLSALDRKTAITSTSVSTAGNDAQVAGVVPIDRTLPFAPLGRRRLWMRDLLTVVPMESGVADFVKEESAIGDASPQTEASAKLENAVTLVGASATAKTVSSWLPVSRQIMDDLPGLAAFIEGSLRYAVLKKEQDLILTGNNTGEQLNGLVTQATAFDTGLLTAADGYTYLDYIGRAAQQLETAEYSQPSFVALNPVAYWNILLKRDAQGKYNQAITVNGDGFKIFGMDVVRTNALAAAQFLVGSGDPRDVVLRERKEFVVSIGGSHSTYFASNMMAILGEERVSLVVFRPGSYITGTLTQSPA
jgi:HK97 family phage major capsid protein